jgi:hypothetical protein
MDFDEVSDSLDFVCKVSLGKEKKDVFVKFYYMMGTAVLLA